MSITKRNCYYSIGASFSLLIGIFLVLLFADSSFATLASTTTASVKVAASCTLTTSGGGNYSATVPNGTSAEIAGSTMSVSCNDAGGFALYAVGYSDDTIGNNNMIGTSTNIPTNTSGTNSYWAMKINPTSGTTPTIENSFNNYHIVPDIHTKIASYASSTGTGSLSVNATYKANISSTQLAGNYLGKVKYTLVHPSNEVPPHEVSCQANRICYNANTNIVEGQMGKQTPSSSELTDGVTLWASNFKRDGYGFAGWSDKYDYETNPDAHFYGPNETITAPSDISTNGLSLYAIWAPSIGSIQSDANTVCNSLSRSGPNVSKTLNSVAALTDDRDGNTYAIAKLADNRCWMIENLRLDDSPTLSAENTHNPSLPLTNVYDLEIVSNRLSPTSSIEYDATTAPEGWCWTNSTACDDQSRLRTDNTVLYTNNTASDYSTYGNVYSYGNYYNWYSATAGHGKYGPNYSDGYHAPGDICPVGWYLPKGANKTNIANNDFWSLIVTGLNNGTTPANYNSSSNPYYTGDESTLVSNALRAYPNNFIFAGVVTSISIGSRNSSGCYWSASGGTRNDAYYMYFYDGFVYPSTTYNLYKYRGRSVRCILNDV